MAATESRMIKLGTTAPGFTLPDAFGKTHTLDNANDASALLIMFICNHCPFVKHVRRELSKIGKDYQQRNVAIFAINSNDAKTHPGDSPENMRREIAEWDYVFPYLVDNDQSVAKAYEAACTPDFFVFDKDQRLVYRGQLDASRPSNDIEVTGVDLRAAIDATLAGKAATDRQIPSIGCNIKWKPGNEPDWYK
ncbi:MAG: thioredoxin family protein [Gammaproteobacteria bacterium]|nr:thioredoxin family protein [Gammaproteobacteria bacterium]MDH4315320.1 thioredoxin family protein [Gammaproteobacteria bacterium]MDH5213435.1 thioredoxin family protein [Gammaproteobacteria bacterium]MDH5500310.1 thioredoxin family protein [Gammaproteobacteria bacterium]